MKFGVIVKGGYNKRPSCANGVILRPSELMFAEEQNWGWDGLAGGPGIEAIDRFD